MLKNCNAYFNRSTYPQMKGLVEVVNQYNMQGKRCFLFWGMPVCSKMTPLCLYFKNKMAFKKGTSDPFELQAQNMPKQKIADL